MRRFLLIPELEIHNANAMSSPYTIGFPAITAWMGAVHALQRHLHDKGLRQVNLKKIAISCHNLDLQTYKGTRDFVHSIIATSNPLGKDGDRPAFIEEARCHLKVSLLIEYDKLDINDDLNLNFENFINAQLPNMKWASGDLLKVKPIETIVIDENNDEAIKAVINKLMLRHVIIERRDLMIKSMHEGQDALDALLGHLKVMHRSDPVLNADEKAAWTSQRKKPGWLVPIAVGFQGISVLGQARNQRDKNTPHRFAESIVTLGEFVMPYRVRKLDDILWEYHADLERNLYLCRNSNSINN